MLATSAGVTVVMTLVERETVIVMVVRVVLNTPSEPCAEPGTFS